MNLLVQMLSETGKPEDISTMRAMSIFSLLVGAGIAMYGIARGHDLNGIAEIVAIFVGAAFTGKTVQKFNEGKDTPDENSKPNP